MSSSPDKIHDDKFENRDEQVDEEMVGETIATAHLTRQVLWKLDVRFVLWCSYLFLPLRFLTASRLLPVLALYFLCSFVDRTNVGNAKILGLEEDIHINDHQYAIGLCVFYTTYIAR